LSCLTVEKFGSPYAWYDSIGMRMRTAVTTAVYRKTLVLSSASRQQRSTGEIVTLTAVDAGKLQV
jgi:hypothetical protein